MANRTPRSRTARTTEKKTMNDTTTPTETPPAAPEVTNPPSDDVVSAPDAAPDDVTAPAPHESTSLPDPDATTPDTAPEEEPEIVTATVTEVTPLEATPSAIHNVDMSERNPLLLIDTIMRNYIAATNRTVAMNPKKFGIAQSELYTVISVINRLPTKDVADALKIIHAYINTSLNDVFAAKHRWRFAGEVESNYVKGRKWVIFTRFYNLMCDTADPKTRKVVIQQLGAGLETAIAAFEEPIQEMIRRYFK